MRNFVTHVDKLKHNYDRLIKANSEITLKQLTMIKCIKYRQSTVHTQM
jgi:hypothetical protein